MSIFTNSELTNLYNCSDFNQVWTFVRDLITTGMDQFIPKVRLKFDQYPKWFSPQMRYQVIVSVCVHYEKTEKTLNYILSTMTYSFRGKFLTKSKLECSLINNFAYNRNPKIFHYIRDFIKTEPFPPILQYGTSKVESDREKAKMLSNYFYSVFTSSDFALPNMKELVKLISDISPRFEEVYQVISTLQTKKACGPDGTGPSVLQTCASPLTPILHYLSLSR